MMLKRVVPVLALIGLTIAACGQEPPPPPEPEVRVDTVVVTEEVEPPLPEGRPATVCLATGQQVQVYISPGGDTLVGPRRVSMRDLGGVGFAGTYAGDTPWFNRDDPIEYDDRSFEKFGTSSSMNCGDVEIVGAYNGVNIFADDMESAPYETVYVPVRPGVFQAYRADVGAVRG